MIISWNWLSQYIKLDLSADELARRLMMAGFNHESTEDVDGDLAIDLEITSNRADCLSHFGVAREVGVLLNRVPTFPDPRPAETGAPVESLTSVEIDEPAHCSRFTARVVTGVKPGPSPWWMQRRLKTLGVRSISNIVDITNYVMFECGQPLHTYDLDLLAERRLVVRRARAGETLRAINAKTYELKPEMLVIADAARPVGLAGVMGGLDTEIGDATKNVLIEAAVFDPVSVRSTARALGLHSPSSFRFERGIDPERTEWASRRCAELILELSGGALHPGVIIAGPSIGPRPAVTLRFTQLSRVLGIDISSEQARQILRALGLTESECTAQSATFTAPSWRPDLEREIDLVEEVARIHGYEHIPEDREVPLTSSARNRRERVEAEVRAILTGLGFDEAYTPSLVAEVLDESLVGGPVASGLRVDHSTRKRENTLRRGLVPSLLAVRAFNESRGSSDASLFEIASVYLPKPQGLPLEMSRLAIVGPGGFFEMKGTIEALVDRLRTGGPLQSERSLLPIFAQGRQAELKLEGRSLGFLGEVDASWMQRLEMHAPCVACELDFDLLMERAQLVAAAAPIPEFPAVERDLSLVVDRGLAWYDLARAVRNAAGPLLEDVSFLDTYQGKGIAEGAHSVHFGLRFRHRERTLKGEEVERALEAVVEACRERLGAALRT